MAAVAWALRQLSPDLLQVQAAVADPQRYVDTAGADALVLLVVPALAWLCWAWGALGLVLTAASTAPGWIGRLAGLLAAGVLPAGARRTAAVALGVGLSTAAPVLLPPAAAPFAVVSAVADDDLGAAPPVPVDGPLVEVTPDWPSVPAGAPDWPRVSAEDHVVLRGDCLWDIAAGWLRTQRAGLPTTDAEVLQAVHAWWDANADVIGADPDVLLPGQVLRAPG
jgi:nucleoid-associated protein YgaU